MKTIDEWAGRLWYRPDNDKAVLREFRTEALDAAIAAVGGCEAKDTFDKRYRRLIWWIQLDEATKAIEALKEEP